MFFDLINVSRLVVSKICKKPALIMDLAGAFIVLNEFSL